MSFPRTINTETAKKTCFKNDNGFVIVEHDNDDDAAITNIYPTKMLPPEFMNDAERAAIAQKTQDMAQRLQDHEKALSYAIALCAVLTPDVAYSHVDLSIYGMGSFKEFSAMRYNGAGWVIIRQGRKTMGIKVVESEKDKDVMRRISMIVDFDPAKVTTAFVTE